MGLLERTRFEPGLKGAKNPTMLGVPAKDGAGDPAIGAIDAAPTQ